MPEEELRTEEAPEADAPEETVCCDRCESEVAENEDLTTVHCTLDREERWCDACHEDHTFTCGDCGRTYHDHCDSWHVRGNTICNSCYERNYFTCEGCDNAMHNDNYGSDGYCQDCEPSDDDSSDEEDDGLPPHNARPPRTFFGKGPHYFGVELEVEVDEDERISDRVDACKGLFPAGFIIAKADGSLNHGFEMVTAPADLDVQRDNWKAFFKSTPHSLKSFSTPTCGLHIHCSRAPLTQLTIAKIVCFVNAQQNRDFVERIAARGASKWARYHHKKLSEGPKWNPERYEAVNLQNSGTIEFRIFKGTLKCPSMLKALEFCDALIRFCMPAERSLNDAIDRDQFLAYVHQNRKRWPHLHAFIQAAWFGIETKETTELGFKVRTRTVPTDDPTQN